MDRICRDELCRNGDLLYSPAALSYTVSQLSESVNHLRNEKALEERVEGVIKEEEVETTETNDSTAQTADSMRVSIVKILAFRRLLQS